MMRIFIDQKYRSYKYSLYGLILLQVFFLVPSFTDNFPYQIYPDDPRKEVIPGGSLEQALRQVDFQAPVYSPVKKYEIFYRESSLQERKALLAKKRALAFCDYPCRLTPELKKVRIQNALQEFNNQLNLEDENSSSQISDSL